MKSNKPSSTRRHASLKNVDRNFTSENRRIILAIILPIIVIALGYFAYCGLSKVYDKLSAIRNTQSLIVDESAQITIKASPHFPEANIKELSDKLYSKYSDAISSLAQEVPATVESISDIYGFSEY